MSRYLKTTRREAGVYEAVWFMVTTRLYAGLQGMLLGP